ncbi:acyltransferase family protein [Leucobacter sp.]
MSRKQLRLDIQGLRAIAVALVVVFHLAPKALPGGYIGVDVFFVISGFLITGHLLREVTRNGRIDLLEFWARRARRLLPAAFLVLLVSTVAVYLVLPPLAREQNFIEIAFSAVYLLNWRLAADSVDYLAEDNAASIAQHYWSLSVEEQFYIVWPILIIAAVWAAARSRRIAPRHAVAAALVLVFATSLAFSVFETARSQPSAYFITTTRAWEFAAGGLIAVLPAVRLRRSAHVALSWIASACIIAPAFIFQASSPFPGSIALIPVLGTAALLWFGDSDSAWSPQYLAKAGPVQLVGDTSYAIYLWHWPLIITATAVLGRAPGWAWGTLIAIATVLLAIATKQLVEDPVRNAPGMLRRRRPTFVLMCAGMAAVLALTITPVAVGGVQTQQRQEAIASASTDETGCFGAYAILNDCDEPYAQASSVDPTAAQRDSFGSYIAHDDACTSEEFAGRSEHRCTVDRDADTTLMLIGDSHMYSIYPAFDALAEEQRWNLEMRARSGCSALGVASVRSPLDKRERCVEWSDEVLDEVSASDTIDLVVYTAYEPTYDHSDAVRAEAERRFEAIRQSGKDLVVLRDVPGTGSKEIEAPSCIEAAGDIDDPCTSPRPAADSWLQSAGKSSADLIVNPAEVVCDPERCHTLIGGAVVYQDYNHLTATFARTLAPWLAQHLVPVAEQRAKA